MKDDSGFAPVIGSALRYEIRGEGEPVVLLHGFSFDRRMWDDQLEPFTRRHVVVRYDLRGFGESSAGEIDYAHADDLAMFLDELRIGRTALVGLSLGGGAAINFAVKHPDRVRALVLVDPSLGGFQWSTESIAMQAALREIAKSRGIEAARAQWLAHPMFATAMSQPAVAARIRRIVAGYSGWHWTNPDRGRPFVPPAIERLGEIRAPTLVIVGERDTSDFHAIADTLASNIPGARREVVPDVGHIVNMEAPERFNELVLDFLSRAGVRASRSGIETPL